MGSGAKSPVGRRAVLPALRCLSLVLAMPLSTCNVGDVDYTGKLCGQGRCPSGWVCSQASGRCAREPDRVPCEASQPRSCRDAPDGTKRTCFPASSLGGEDYCVPGCDPEGTADAGFACVGTGALVQTCDPAGPETCPAGSSCFRTDLSPLPGLLYPVQDPGLCIAAPLCRDDTDCADHPSRTRCGGVVLAESYPVGQFIPLDRLQCVETCDIETCSDDQYCLPWALDDPGLPPVCLPSCEFKPCPPTFYCLRDTGPGYVPVCAPGLPGFRCSRPEDCLLGHCVDTGAGLSLCVIDCDRDEDCALVDTIRGRSRCIGAIGEGAQRVRGHCISRGALAGQICRLQSDCPDGEICSGYSPIDRRSPRLPENRECRRPCDDEGACAPVVGIPFTCLENGECYPGDLGIECQRDEECIGPELRCLCVSGCDSPASAETLCTKECQRDEECVGYSIGTWTCHDGFCQITARLTP